MQIRHQWFGGKEGFAEVPGVRVQSVSAGHSKLMPQSIITILHVGTPAATMNSLRLYVFPHTRACCVGVTAHPHQVVRGPISSNGSCFWASSQATSRDTFSMCFCLHVDLPSMTSWRSTSQTGYLRADRPLLALTERPGSGRDLVMEGTLTEPLNTARLS